MFGTRREEIEKEKHINLRPFALSAAALAAGAGFCYAALYCGVHFLWSLLFFIPLVLWVLFARRGKRIRAIAYAFLCLALLGVGMGGFALRMEAYSAQTFREGEYAFVGTISELTATQEGYTRVLLTDITADGRALDGNATVYFYAYLKNGEEGMKVAFTGKLSPAGSALRYGSFRADMVLSDIKYTATCSAAPVYVGDGGNIFTSVRTRIRSVLYASLNEEEAALAYALTTGNTDGIEEGLMESVRYGGVAHIFAVSGLHIGIVYGALALLFKKLRAPRWLRLPIPLVAAFLFCGVCGFSASALRAFLICLAFAFCPVFGVRRDGIEGAGFACAIILLLNPVHLLSVGFQLSMAAYLSIVALAPAFERGTAGILRKAPVLKKPLSALAVGCAVQLGMLPVMLNSFGYVSVWGLLLNLAVLPLFSLFFPILLAAVMLSCLFPVAAPVFLFLPGKGLALFAAVFRFIDFSSLLLKGFVLSFAACVCFYLLLFLWSGRINVREGMLSPLACFLAAAVVVQAVLVNYIPPQTCRVVQMCYYDDYCCALVQTENADVLIVNGRVDSSRLQTFLFRHGAAPDAVVITAENANAVAGSLLFTPFETAYVPADVTLELRTRRTVSADAFSVDGADYRFHADGSVSVVFGDITGGFGPIGSSAAAKADFTLFPAEGRDGLIFRMESGILSVNR